MSQVTISGAVSGLDTAAVINTLMSVDRQQQTLLSNRKSAAQKTVDAYTNLTTALRGLADQARELATTSSWAGTRATSTSSTVSATATGMNAAALTFDVTATAAAHTLASTSTVGSTATVVASGPLTLTGSDGTPRSIDVGGGSLAEVVGALNATGTGVRAAAVQVSPGQYRLQVSAATTGAASAFTLAGLDGFDGTAVITAGSDATLLVGQDPATAYQVRSASNTFDALIPGLSFTVSRPETGVSVSAEVDGSAVADKVAALVQTANGVLSSIASQTAYDSTTGTGGPLLGESAVRQLQQNVLGAVGGAGAAGVSLTRDGRLAFDRQKFLSAFSADPQAVARAYGAGVEFSPAQGVSGTATLVRAGDATRPGSYAVQIAASAAREQWQVDTGGSIAGRTIVLMRGSMVVTYTAGANDTLADAVNAINSRAAAAGLNTSAIVVGGAIMVTANSPGAAQAFSVTLDGAPATQVTAGRDIAGSIGGVAATGIADVLTVPSASASPAAGLAVRFALSEADVSSSGGAVGSVSYTPGLAQRLVHLVSTATRSDGGALTAAQNGQEETVKDLQRQIEAWDTRLETRRAALVRQFAGLETTLAALRSQSSFLSGLSASG